MLCRRVFVALAIAAGVVPWEASAERMGRASVIDGDTVQIAGERIRLWGMDAPESAQQCTGRDGRSWPCGRRAAAALDDHLLNQTVRCTRKDTDRYGRTVAECFVQGQSVNRWLVRQGWAVAYREYSTAYVAEETQARGERRGIWQGTFQMPAEYRRAQRSRGAPRSTPPRPAAGTPAVRGGCTIKGNISSSGAKIYHSPGQRDYARTRIDTAQGERMFCSAAEAERAGWRAAQR